MDARAAESLLNLAERAGPGLKGLDAKALFGQLEQQYADLLAAMQWFIDQGRTDESIRLANSLAPFWTATKRLDEGSAWFDRTLRSPGGEGAHRARASVHAGLLPSGRVTTTAPPRSTAEPSRLAAGLAIQPSRPWP